MVYVIRWGKYDAGKQRHITVTPRSKKKTLYQSEKLLNY